MPLCKGCDEWRSTEPFCHVERGSRALVLGQAQDMKKQNAQASHVNIKARHEKVPSRSTSFRGTLHGLLVDWASVILLWLKHIWPASSAISTMHHSQDVSSEGQLACCLRGPNRSPHSELWRRHRSQKHQSEPFYSGQHCHSFYSTNHTRLWHLWHGLLGYHR